MQYEITHQCDVIPSALNDNDSSIACSFALNIDSSLTSMLELSKNSSSVCSTVG